MPAVLMLSMQVACRLLGSDPLLPSTKQKISMFCHVAEGQVVGVHDVSSVYHVPLLLESQGLVQYFQKRLDLTSLAIPKPMLEKGEKLRTRWTQLTKKCGLISTINDVPC